MISKGPGFIVLYRWRLHPGNEESFIQSWTRISEILRARGSLGSRLHRGPDNIWYSYAQWPNASVRTQAFSLPSGDPVASEAMRAAVAESFPEIVLESVADLLILPNEDEADETSG